MTSEQRQRARDHYAAEAAVALRIEQLEAELQHQYAALSDLLVAAGSHYAVRAHVEREMKRIRAALAKAGASQ